MASESLLNVTDGNVEVLSKSMGRTQKITTKMPSSYGEKTEVIVQTEHKREGKRNKTITRASLVEKRSVGC